MNVTPQTFMGMTKHVLDVGQCSMDHGAITRMLQGHFDVEVTRAHDADDLIAALETSEFDLVLVNRKLDRNGEDGVELIRRIVTDEKLNGVPCMLVSNYADAQEAAVDAGARPGFGKSALAAELTIQRLRDVLS